MSKGLQRAATIAICVSLFYYVVTKEMQKPTLSAARAALIDDLADALVSISDRDEARSFLVDLCTPSEMHTLAERWHVARLLDAGEMTYREIHDATGVSTTTTEPPPVETYPPTVDPDTGETIPGGVVETAPTTVAPAVIQLISATTIPPNVGDPYAPLPSIDVRTPVLSCAALPPNVIQTNNTVTLPPAAP